MSKGRKKAPSKKPKKANNEALKELREQLGVFDFVEVTNGQQTDDRVRLALRVDEEEEQSWFRLIKFILREEKRQSKKRRSWSTHICRQFVLHPEDENKLGYMWNLIIRANDIDRAVSDVCRIIDVASNAVIMGEEEPATKRPGRTPTPSRGRRKALAHARRWRAPDTKVRGGRPGTELREYDLGADHIVPEVGLMAPQGKRKGAHLIGG